MKRKLRTFLLLLIALAPLLPQDAAASIPRTSYGGLQGLGGLEAVIGSDGITRGIVNDWFGNTAGYVAAPGQAMTWSPAQFLAWGPAPGWSTRPLDGTKPLHELLGYRGLTVDPPGYIQMGLRPYDPQTGRWLSPDPVGHAGSLSLYDYCDNDPLNVFDPDGRFGKSVASFAYNGGGVGQGLGAISSGFDSLGNYGVNRGNAFIAGLGGGASSLFGSLSAMTTPKTYVNSAIGFANNISTVNSFSGPVAATSYALTSWNVGAVYSGIANVDLVTGGPVGDWADRGARISSGVAATAGIASAGLGGFSHQIGTGHSHQIGTGHLYFDLCLRRVHFGWYANGAAKSSVRGRGIPLHEPGGGQAVYFQDDGWGFARGRDVRQSDAPT